MAHDAGSPLLPSSWEIHPEFRRRLGDQAGRQRLMTADGHLLLVLHAPPSADSDERQGRFYWRDAAGRWTPSGASPAQPGAGELLLEYEQAVDALQHVEDEAESARDYFELLNRLNPLVRAARNLYQTIQDAREAAPDDRSLILWRDRAYVISRSAELLHNDAQHALDFAVAQRAEEEAEFSRHAATASRRLNILVACFFPIATLAAIFGMNLSHGLDGWDRQYAPLPLLAILGAGLLAGVFLTLFINRKH
jgi:Mg2+ and Co2+ transporter CorA